MPQKRKLYYGWIVVLGSFVACGLMLYAGITAFSIFVTPVTSTLGIPVTAFMVCATLRSIGGVISSPIGGKLLDTKGLRFTVVMFAAVMALGFGILTISDTLVMFYIGYFVVGLSSGPTTAMVNAISSRWFRKNRGLANGVINAGSGLSTFVLSPVLAAVAAAGGYQKAYGLIVALLLGGGVVIGFLLIRNDPGDMGLLPDGAEQENKTEKQEPVKELTGLTMKEVYKTKSFWLLAFGLGFFTLASLGILQTWNAAFQSRGFDAVTVGFAVSVYGIISVPVKLIFGAVADRLKLRDITIIGFGLFVLSAILLGTLNSTNIIFLWLFAIAFAIGNNSWQALFVKYIVRCFGLKSVGSVSGVISMFMNAGGMVGPLVAGMFFDINGSYNMAYLIFAVITAGCCIALLCTKNEMTSVT